MGGLGVAELRLSDPRFPVTWLSASSTNSGHPVKLAFHGGACERVSVARLMLRPPLSMTLRQWRGDGRLNVPPCGRPTRAVATRWRGARDSIALKLDAPCVMAPMSEHPRPPMSLISSGWPWRMETKSRSSARRRSKLSARLVGTMSFSPR
jgi:hypothetical protein